MPLSFLKMHANGDDFVLIDLRNSAHTLNNVLAQRLGDRRRGIGFNQLAILQAGDGVDADATLTFWNADGSPLATCGSATRGAAYVLLHETRRNDVTLRTRQGLLRGKQMPGGDISVGMGLPRFGWESVPLARELDTLWLPLAGTPAACSMGNPHCTFFIDDLTSTDVAAMGPAIEKDPLFPLGTNVHFVQVIDRGRIRLRIWERGGGIPLGSGSCSCAAVINGIRRGLLDATVEVECDGGSVFVTWDGVGPVTLSGPVVPVYSGVISDAML